MGQSSIAAVSTGMDKAANLPFWELKEKGVRFRLVQRLPDQTRAYFLKRGFTLKQVENIAKSCVFQTIFHNKSPIESKQNLSYDLKQWVLIRGKKRSKMKTREDWTKIWSEKNIKMGARIAFKWSLLPTRQVYQPGDHNWGMSIFNFKPGEKFSLKMKWSQGGTLKTAIIKDIVCASDIHPQSK